LGQRHCVIFNFGINDYYTDLHKKSFVVRSLYAYIKQIGISCIAFMCFSFMFSLFLLLLCVYWCAFVAS